MTMTHAHITVPLTGGTWLDGEPGRDAEIRAVTGEDEVFLLEAGEGLRPAQQVTCLLARCLVGLGGHRPVATEHLRALTVGDREALMLDLRRLAFGDDMSCVLTCSQPECDTRLDPGLRVSDLRLPPYERTASSYETTIHDGGTSYRVRFRLPTGGDQELAASRGGSDVRAEADELLWRCVESVKDADSGGDLADERPDVVAHDLPATMADLDPQAEIILNVTCPTCGHGFAALLDASGYFLQELAIRRRRVQRDVHLLAYYYHWGEQEILAMTPRRRERHATYLEDALREGARR
jgi:hypothetical protein